MHGYAGKLLRVDLMNERINEATFNDALSRLRPGASLGNNTASSK